MSHSLYKLRIEKNVYFLKTEILKMPPFGEKEELYFNLYLLNKLVKRLSLSKIMSQ